MNVGGKPLGLWYDVLQNDHPFNLDVKVTSGDPQCSTPFRAVSIFPWDITSLDKLWNGEFASEPAKLAQWQKTFDKWSGVVAVGSGASRLRLFLSRPHQQYLPLFTVEVPEMRTRFGDEEKFEKADIRCIAWCMVQNADGFWPLVAFSGNGILYLLNVEKGNFHGVLRGHGGKITSLAVHPVDPCILASTSYDNTCRIYDLTKRVDCKIDNPNWPGKSHMALSGAPFGLRSNESEGIDYGRCFAILVGGASGGHSAPVLGAAFHPLYPVIATCGMDHAVKLWRLPETKGDRISREDKPLFSSTDMHSAQVLTITWMSKDVLMSNSGLVIVRSEETSHIYSEPGTLVLWKWLGFDRFFPLDRNSWPSVLRGCSSDYQGSSSYKVIAEYSLPHPQQAVRACVFQTPAHTPLIALPSLGCVHLSSVQHFNPRPPRVIVYSVDELTFATDRLDLNADGAEDTRRKVELPCWIVEAPKSSKRNKRNDDGGHEDEEEDTEDGLPKLESCAIGEDGRLLIGVGAEEGIWIWRIPRDKQLRRGLVSDKG